MKIGPQIANFQQGGVSQRSVSAGCVTLHRGKILLPAAIVGGPFPRGQCILAIPTNKKTLTFVTHLPSGGCRINF
jgi:hypothetical protein